MADWKSALKRSGIPLHMRGAIIRWIEQGLPPGSFLTAVLENDLIGAVAYADDVNATALRAYVCFFYNCAPAACRGSPERVREWARQCAREYEANEATGD